LPTSTATSRRCLVAAPPACRASSSAKEGRKLRRVGAGQPWAADKSYEDWGALFFDANGDGRPDLYVASCGYQHTRCRGCLQDRLYINQGGGKFVRDVQALQRCSPAPRPWRRAISTAMASGSVRRRPADAAQLPLSARSYILRNDGGRFTDVTAQVAPELMQPFGMVTAAVWTDFDGDGRLDLVTAGEWMPLEFWHNDGKKLVKVSVELPPTRGWWWSLAAADFNHDGRPTSSRATWG